MNNTSGNVYILKPIGLKVVPSGCGAWQGTEEYKRVTMKQDEIKSTLVLKKLKVSKNIILRHVDSSSFPAQYFPV